ncbi:MAG TPA: mechanosensitive ion channel family protein, partial [Longimicrobiales bacterium]|nr:mechanosensitive ion channel family protein [Longimicrobiales bacterium]
FGVQLLQLPSKTAAGARIAVFFAFLLQLALWGNVFIARLIHNYAKKRLEDDAAMATTVRFAGFLARMTLWIVIVLVAMDNLGIQITTLVAGLGVGGVAVALAVQNVLGDLFASLSIVLDKPFVIGDFIIVGDLMGTVEHVGLKTTRLRSLGGEQLVFSNSDLLNSRIRNYKRMFERRIVFSFGVLYQTPRETLEKIPGVVREIIEALEDTRLDRAHFARFGPSSLDFEVVYYVLKPDYNTYMDRQQAINLELMRRFEDMGVEFAYPTQTIFLESAGPAEPGDGPGEAR